MNRTAPAGYIGILARVYNSSGVLYSSNSMAYNSNTISMGAFDNICAYAAAIPKGAYYSSGYEYIWNTSVPGSYNSFQPPKSPNQNA